MTKQQGRLLAHTLHALSLPASHHHGSLWNLPIDLRAGADIKVGTFNSLSAAQLSYWGCSIRESTCTLSLVCNLLPARRPVAIDDSIFVTVSQVIQRINGGCDLVQTKSLRHTTPASQRWALPPPLARPT